MASLTPHRDSHGKLMSYYIRVYRGRDATGRQLKPWSTTFKVDPSWTERRARREAEKYAVIYEEECKRGRVSSSAITLGEFMMYMIELKNNRGQLKRRTYALYKQLARKISDELGYMKIRDIRIQDINDYYSKLSGSLSPKTVSEYHGIIKMTLDQAVKEGVVNYNVANAVEKPKTVKPKVNYYQREEILSILAAADNESPMHKLLIYTFAFTGCRRAEVLALTWDCIDFANRCIYIKSSLLYAAEYGVFIDTPKTSNSVRQIIIPELLIDLYRCYQKMSPGQRFIFSDGTGERPLHPDSVNRYLTRFSKKYNLPHINSHAFRHTMASLLYAEGVDPVSISSRLGHSRVSITSDIYAHRVNNSDEKSSDTLADLYIVDN